MSDIFQVIIYFIAPCDIYILFYRGPEMLMNLSKVTWIISRKSRTKPQAVSKPLNSPVSIPSKSQTLRHFLIV